MVAVTDHCTHCRHSLALHTAGPCAVPRCACLSFVSPAPAETPSGPSPTPAAPPTTPHGHHKALQSPKRSIANAKHSPAHLINQPCDACGHHTTTQSATGCVGTKAAPVPTFKESAQTGDFDSNLTRRLASLLLRARQGRRRDPGLGRAHARPVDGHARRSRRPGTPGSRSHRRLTSRQVVPEPPDPPANDVPQPSPAVTHPRAVCR